MPAYISCHSKYNCNKGVELSFAVKHSRNGRFRNSVFFVRNECQRLCNSLLEVIDYVKRLGPRHRTRNLTYNDRRELKPSYRRRLRVKWVQYVYKADWTFVIVWWKGLAYILSIMHHASCLKGYFIELRQQNHCDCDTASDSSKLTSRSASGFEYICSHVNVVNPRPTKCLEASRQRLKRSALIDHAICITIYSRWTYEVCCTAL